MSLLVLGVGNVLLTDEGVGIRAVDELRGRYRFPETVEIVDGGTSGIELLRFIEDREHLIIVDAVKSGHAPGTVVRVEGEDVPAKFRTRISPHQLGLSDLLATAQLSGKLPPHLVLFGVEPGIIETGLGLSEEVSSALSRLVQVIVEEIRKLGYEVENADVPEGSATSFWEAR